ncbi:major facilitator superfamily domain-containing protein [Crucibulum laeve]|uniref:Probable transporter MCH1 n=1 Tax=Crucibulum laeve TaxID=68775 RepID=A0A5C3MNE3_9AGAR|nr:major facilitator superfamily domain-containing protein [Crucibulum laeve]
MLRLRVPQSAQTLLTCCSIAGNALCAGGIFTFPLVSPALASNSKLTQPQLTTIVLAGMMSQYPFAAIVGKIIDQRGPSVCSFAAALLFSSGFGAFAFDIYYAPTDASEPSSPLFHRLTFFFLLAGLGTVFSYFSSLFAASKAFPTHLGLASGTSLALFGLSPLFLSFIASTFFTDPTSGLLIVSQYMAFLAVMTGCVNIFGVFALKCIPGVPNDKVSHPPQVDAEAHLPEDTTPLLPPKSNKIVDSSSLGLLKDTNFWLLAIFCVITLGASEMIISNIGTIVLSLPSALSGPQSGRITTDASTAHQVRLLSISNTISRIAVGPLADFVSPVASCSLAGVKAYPRKHRISRIAFLFFPAFLLALTFLWMEYGVTSQANVWALSVGTGLGYSAIFTVLPSIMSSVWGIDNLGRNFGMMMFAPFTGTPLFSYIYAFVSASHSSGGGICEGRSCWQTTFWTSFSASILAMFISAILWKRWHDRV